MKPIKIKAGVMGGLGPMATVYFLKMIIELTNAKCDQDNIDMLISNTASTYDRTDYITGQSSDNPQESLIDDAKKLEQIGADFLVITCNTAHYFYDKIQENVKIPVINMIDETIKYVKNNNYKKIGILATDGTLEAKIYQRYCDTNKLNYEILDEENQKCLMDIIYKDIKSGNKVSISKFNNLISSLKDKGCDGVILGCTELSVLKNDNNLSSDFYIDSLEILARKTISLCK